jgi:hypothetical protein
MVAKTELLPLGATDLEPDVAPAPNAPTVTV